MATTDFTAWYFQLPISEVVYPYLCVNVNGKIYTHARAPMGHKWMVFVAHVVSLVLAHTRVCAYDVIIDNAAYGGDDFGVNMAMGQMKENCDKAHATLGDVTNSSEEIQFKGVRLNARTKTMALSDKFIRKLANRLNMIKQKSTAARLWSLAGMLSWTRIVLRVESLDDFVVWKFMARVMTRSAEEVVRLPSYVEAFFDKLTETCMGSRVVVVPRKVMSMIVTDASLHGGVAQWGAVVIKSRMTLYRGVFPLEGAKHSIAYYEMLAVAMALYLSSEINGSVVVLCDNQAVVKILEKRRSSAYPLHWMVKKIFMLLQTRDLTVRVFWIPSDQNPADGLSRGAAFTERDADLSCRLSQKFGMEDEARTTTLTTSKNHNVKIISPMLVKKFLFIN
jgi:hypothetical protein